MKVYTRTGDDGRTDLFGGGRVAKTNPRVEAYGTVDELNAALGLAASLAADADIVARLSDVQRRLFDLGADIATPPDASSSRHVRRASPSWVTDLESSIDDMTAELPPLAGFILPGGSPGSAALHQARTVCRRAERRVLDATESGEEIAPPVLVFLNRLSDWLFTVARLANARADVSDRLWQSESPDR